MIGLTILKVIGIILLVILGLLLFLLFLFLFCPIKYWAKGIIRTTQYNVDYKVRWLFGIIRVFGHADTEESNMYYKIFWKRKNFSETEDDEEELIDEENTSSVEFPAQSTVEADEVPNKNEEDLTEISHEYSKDYNKDDNKDDNENKINNIFSKIKVIPKQIKTFYRNIRKKKKKLFYIFQDEKCKSGIGHLKKEIFWLLKKITPKKFVLNLNFSTGEPDKTGIVLGVIAMFPIGYKNKWNITPDFESDNLFVDADFEVKGKVYLVSVALSLLRLYVDKNCRKLYNIINR